MHSRKKKSKETRSCACYLHPKCPEIQFIGSSEQWFNGINPFTVNDQNKNPFR